MREARVLLTLRVWPLFNGFRDESRSSQFVLEPAHLPSSRLNGKALSLFLSSSFLFLFFFVVLIEPLFVALFYSYSVMAMPELQTTRLRRA